MAKSVDPLWVVDVKDTISVCGSHRSERKDEPGEGEPSDYGYPPSRSREVGLKGYVSTDLQNPKLISPPPIRLSRVSLGGMSGDSSGRTRRIVLVAAGLIFAAIIVISVGLALSTPVSLPQASSTQTNQGAPPPYVVVAVYKLSSTTYTTTYTTTPQPQVYVVIIPEVIVVVNGSQTYTVTTTTTSTSTSWS